jgi:hypothetical protein
MSEWYLLKIVSTIHSPFFFFFYMSAQDGGEKFELVTIKRNLSRLSYLLRDYFG